MPTDGIQPAEMRRKERLASILERENAKDAVQVSTFGVCRIAPTV